MSLPGHLEVLMGGDGGDEADGDELAAEWLDKVVRGAGLTYADAILRIPALSAAGAAQLAADAEYFCNVMSALAVAPPPVLITVQVRAAPASAASASQSSSTPPTPPYCPLCNRVCTQANARTHT
ncbi:MAG: Golgi complex component 7-domain-containing protein [Monoraphidium minutum]|nr:MAG: Golgi complex component 7-domain-containing protein [Monoraphidium minutum]